MSEPTRPDPEPAEPPPHAQDSRINRRRDRIVSEIQRNRRGQYRVPTWVLTVTLVALIAGWVLLVALS